MVLNTEKSDSIIKNQDLDVSNLENEASLIAADLSGILGTTLCGLIKVCD